MFRRTNDRLDAFLTAARDNLGYVSRPGMQSYHGSKVGYTGVPWAGAFIDVVAREAGLELPRCTYTPAGMAEFMRQRRWHARPRPGDIVFFSFATGSNFDMPHCGIVTDVSEWDSNRRFRSIEGMVSSGLPRGTNTADGVHERTRYGYEVIGFGRPAFFKLRPARKLDGLTVSTVRISHLRPAKGKTTEDIRTVQLALVAACGLRGYKAGMWDGSTRSAFAAWQRRVGFVGTDVTGMPDEVSLRRLGESTGLFQLK